MAVVTTAENLSGTPPGEPPAPSVAAFHSTPPFRVRFDVHLPTVDNDKRIISLRLIDQACDEVGNKFGGYTTSSTIGTPVFFGYWKDPKTGQVYRDYIYIIHVDVEYDMRKINDAVEFFKRFRRRYMKIFNQNEVYIIYFGNVTKIE